MRPMKRYGLRLHSLLDIEIVVTYCMIKNPPRSEEPFV